MWRRWTCWLAAVLLISACSHGTLTRVVRTDGTAVVGELTEARPDAVVLKLADGSTLTIPRSLIRTIESAPANAVASSGAGGSGAGAGGGANGGNAGGVGGGTGAGAGGSAAKGPGGNAGGSGVGGSGGSGSSSASGSSSGSSGGARGANGNGASAAAGPGASNPGAGHVASSTGGGNTGGGAANGGTAGANGGRGSSGGSGNGNAGAGGSGGSNASGSSNASGGAPPKVAHEAVAPSGTTLELSLNTPIGSDTSSVADKVDAVLRAPLIVNGEEILEAGALAHGVVTEATPSGKADGRGRLAVRFDAIEVGSQAGPRTLSIQSAPLRWEAPGVAKRPPPPPEEKGSFFHRVVTKTKRGLRIGEDAVSGARGSAEVHFAPGATLRIRLEQAARLAP